MRRPKGEDYQGMNWSRQLYPLGETHLGSMLHRPNPRLASISSICCNPPAHYVSRCGVDRFGRIPLWVCITAGGVDHASWCRPLWVYATAGGADHFWCTPQPARNESSFEAYCAPHTSAASTSCSQHPLLTALSKLRSRKRSAGRHRCRNWSKVPELERVPILELVSSSGINRLHLRIQIGHRICSLNLPAL